MAYHFSANQFEPAYRAKRLRNWEVPKWYPEHPRTPLTTTSFIADSRGHLLPGVPKSNPWGSYKGTWELPKRITKQLAKHISAPPKKLQTIWGKRRAPQTVQEQTQESVPERLPVLPQADEGAFVRRNKSSSALDLGSGTPKKLLPIEAAHEHHESSPNIEPGTLDNDIKHILEKTAENQVVVEEPALCRAIECLQEQGDGEKEDLESVVGEEMVADDKQNNGPLLMHDYSSFQVAKRFHDENLKHQPLPDVVDDPVFKALASHKHPYPGSGLNIQPSASAIGWKGAQGPTKCSKIRVYRPKTAVNQLKPAKQDSRPKTCEPRSENRFNPIDLAICWDLAPNEKPKRSMHIDGSGGGEAPSVFTVVVRPDDCHVDVPGSAQAVASHVAPCVKENNVGTLPPKIGACLGSPPHRVTNKGAIMCHVKAIDSPNDSYHSLTPEAAEVARNNPKTAWTDHDTSKVLSEKLEKIQSHGSIHRKASHETWTPLSRQKHHQSTPNLASVDKKKTCEGSNCGTESTVDKKKDSKISLKAATSQNAGKPVKMPKMRPPYVKKNYSIGTLIPPFSLWPDHHGQEYPEHWRLASVYQHSFKPLDCRRKTLLASVYQ